jgi:hypothetical protein
MSATISSPTESTAPGATSYIPIADSGASGQKRKVGKTGLVYLLGAMDAVAVGASTLALSDAHCGKYILLNNALSAISINTDNVADGWNVVVVNNTGSTYTFPTPSGSGASLVGPVNSDTKIPNNGVVTIMAVGNAIYWRGDSTT